MNNFKDFKEFEEKYHSPVDDIDDILSISNLLPKDIYMFENKYYNEMPINPELKKYIDKVIEKKIKQIRKDIILTTEESLIRLWDNEDDDVWNDF